jgi:uncharacterized membrane protein YdjX (TVP38/TMEM64 family)
VTTVTAVPADMPPAAKRAAPLWRRLLPLAVLLAAIALVFATGLHRYLSFDALRENRQALQAFVADNYLAAALLYLAVYAAAVALSVPGAIILTVTGGFLFGSLAGTALVVIGATTGATLLFLIAKTALGDSLRRRAGGLVTKLEAGFRENALSYLLVLRLVPLFPFWLVNLAAAVLGVPLATYVLGTAVGIIPGSYVFATVGAGLGSVFDQGGEPSLAGVLTSQVLTALIGLAVLSLIPVAYKKLKGRSTANP